MSQSDSYDEYGFVAEFYDHVVPYRDRDDVHFYMEMAQQAKGKVLEIGCGTGRILIPIANSGVKIIGIDLSKSMLSVCQQKLRQESKDVQARVELIQADMRHFDLHQKFDLIVIPFRAFQHILAVEDQLTCLNNVYKHLNDKGNLILDLFNPALPRLVDNKYLKEVDEEPEFQMPDGRIVIRRNQLVSRDLANQILEVEIIYYITHPDQHTERLVHRFAFRYFFRFEVEHLLARSGFQVEALYGDYRKNTFGPEISDELIFVARKI